MRRTLVYGAALAVSLGVIGYAVYDDEQDDTPGNILDATLAEEYIDADRQDRVSVAYREIVPNATDEQIAAWEDDAAEYERQTAAADRCEDEAQGDMDDASLDAADSELQAAADEALDRFIDTDASPGSEEYERLHDEADAAQAAADDAADASSEDYNAAVDRVNSCDDEIVDLTLVDGHPFYEVDQDSVTYLGP